MKYFLPDAQDFVDPSFDFEAESKSADRIRQRDDLYAHELLSARPYDGLLLSKAIVEAPNGGVSYYSQAQRLRLLREGAREFLRLHGRNSDLALMGDCGAFSYISADAPPFSVDDVLEFYEQTGVDYGISVDHIITQFKPQWDNVDLFGSTDLPSEVRSRYDLTLDLARDFLSSSRSQRARSYPVGAAQAWSPASFASAVVSLQSMGYDYVALGGLVTLRSDALLDVVRAVSSVRRPETRVHLLGVARLECIEEFARLGVASFDSTSPLRQAFLDNKNNYYTDGGALMAIRVPQTHANPTVKRRVEAGEIDMDQARIAEARCLDALREYALDQCSIEHALSAIGRYETIHNLTPVSRSDGYRSTLEARPWDRCPCEACASAGHHIVLLRGNERNRRRGHHNVLTFYGKLKKIDAPDVEPWDFFWTTPTTDEERGGAGYDDYWRARQAWTGRLWLPASTHLEGALDASRRSGLIQDEDDAVGCFEIQAPRGIYQHVGGHRNLRSSHPGDVSFRSWEEIELDDDVLVVGLVSCSKLKREASCVAQELYDPSFVFRKSASYARRHCDTWHILSAKHGLLDPNEPVCPYDDTLAGAGVARRREWGRNVRDSLERRYGSTGVRYVLLAGESYKYAVDGLRFTEPLRSMSTGKRRQWLARNA